MAQPTIVVTQNGNPLLTARGPVTFGNRVGNDVVVEDVAIADRHLEVTFDGVFRLRDLGSVTGTWLDGRAVTAAEPIRDGATIVFGTSLLRARLEAGDGPQPKLVLELERQGFWWKKPGKEVFDNDPDAMVRREVGFGRFPLLHTSNRVAIAAAAALLLASTFVAAVMEPLADPGPLQPPHALVVAAAAGRGVPRDVHAGLQSRIDVARQQGCDACHTVGAGAPASKCLGCHEDLAAPTTWRHPYIGDGTMAAVPGMAAGEQFCVVCHRDHQGQDAFKPVSATLTGDCAACHAVPGTTFDRAALEAKAPKVEVVMTTRSFAAYRFPHDVHVAKAIDCTVCHRADDDVRADVAAGLPTDPRRQDYVDTPYETCASCHVPDSSPHHMTAAEQQRWRASDEHRWPVAWHGTDDGGRHCRTCHAETQRDGRTVQGPEFRTVTRPVFTAEQYAAERARYSSPARSHEQQFAAHAQGRECTTCHVTGVLRAETPRPARPFWHALHAIDGALLPAAGRGGAISSDPKTGCVSCHAGLRDSSALLPAAQGAFQWPATSEAQTACKQCHIDGERQLLLAAANEPMAPARVAASPSIDFPHDAHVGSPSFGQAGGRLAEGCFACHEFSLPQGGAAFQAVPRTKADALDCRTCHAGHAHVGGNSCQQCHPVEPERSNSFLIAAALPAGTQLPGRATPVPAPPMRSWPKNDSFSHWSPGHVGEGITCATCHDAESFRAAKTLEATPVPDEAHPSCRDCHLRKQFHWR